MGPNIVEAYIPSLYAQEKIDIDIKDVTLVEFFKEIQRKTEYIFLYKEDVLNDNVKISVSLKESSLDEILRRAFLNTNLIYEISDRQVLVKKLSGKAEVIDLKTIQETILVSGIISETGTGMPIPGVNIMENGTQNGTSTDFDGNYSIKVSKDAVLVVSYVGYATQKIEVKGLNNINIVLETDTAALEEVVVVGYGTQKKQNLTGAVATVSGEELSNQPLPNVGAALAGISPNLSINVGGPLGGEPGARRSWSIRGLGSLSGNDSPLILVDGVEMDIDNLDPQNIESVSVLKDASASAIYGARAPFGVVLITTKKGKTDGKVSVQYNTNMVIGTKLGIPHMESSVVYATAYNQASANAGRPPVYSDELVERMKGYIAGTITDEYDPNNPPNSIWATRRLGNANYDYTHLLLKDAKVDTKHNVHVSGGNEKTQFYVSMGYFDEEGYYAVGYDEYKRYDILSNIDTKATDWLTFGLSTKYANSRRDYPQGITTVERENFFTLALNHFAPNTVLYNIDGSIANPIYRNIESAGRDISVDNDLLVTLKAEIEPVTGWKTRFSYNYNFKTGRRESNPKPVMVKLGNGEFGNVGKPISSYASTMTDAPYSLFNMVSTYEKGLGDHNFNILAGYEQEEKNFYQQYARAENLITDQIPSLSTALGAVVVDDTIWSWSTMGVFGRFNYNYQEKYLLEVSGRYNGSSKFAKDSRWGFFPSVSAGYVISKESFWEPIKTYVNSFKVRASYGQLGNQNVDNYLHSSSIPINIQTPWIIAGARPPYADAPNLLSSGLTWETITSANLGIDAAFLNNRLNLTVEVFNRKTTDMFGPQETLPYTLGANTPLANNASLETKGFEVILGWKDRLSDNFSYHAQVTLGDNKSIITKYKNDNGLISTWYSGKVVGEMWGLTTDKIIQSPTEEMPDQSAFHPRWGPGDIKYKDLNGDGKVSYGARTLDDHGDLSIIGNSQPRYNYGVNGGFKWKNLDFAMQWMGVGKRDFYPYDRMNTFWGLATSWTESAVFKGTPALDYWRPADETNMLGPNTDAYLPKPYFSTESVKNRRVQTGYLLNAAYFRLKTVQIGYTVPTDFVKARIFFTGGNLLTFTKLPKAIDPEQGLTAGVTGGGYPISRTFTLGLNLNF
ncbi:TonB-dependent receptor [Aestuariibaculum suncheonense]